MVNLKDLIQYATVFILCILTACNSDEEYFQKQLLIPSEQLSIDNSRDTLLIGAKGTIIYFEKESFELPSGASPKGKISIQLKECYSNSDIVRENLSTVSDGKLLESRGMINITAFSGNQELQLKQGKKFIIHFPKKIGDDKKLMNLFYAENNTKSKNWKIDSLSLLKFFAFLTNYSFDGFTKDGDKIHQFGVLRYDTLGDLFSYFNQNLDTKKFPIPKDSSEKSIRINFSLDKNGKAENIKIRVDSIGETIGELINSQQPYLYQFISQLPEMNQLFEEDLVTPIKNPIELNIIAGYFPNSFKGIENYYNLFNKKYAAYKNNSVLNINEVELNYYIFNASKLGWINCDYFWNTPDEKIDYVIETHNSSKLNVKLIFKNAKSIMDGVKEGNNYVFKNVPINQDVKVVIVTQQREKPQLSVTETKTSKKVFNTFNFKDFSLSELEKELNTP